MDIDRLENEGGIPLTACSRCAKMKVIYEDDMCLACWLKVHPHYLKD